MENPTPATPAAPPKEGTPQTQVGAIMTRNVLTAKAETPVVDIVRLMAKNKITGLPVVDAENHLIGVVSESDIIGKAGDTVANISPTAPCPGPKNPPRGEAAEIILRRRTRRLPIVRGDNELIGLLSRS